MADKKLFITLNDRFMNTDRPCDNRRPCQPLWTDLKVPVLSWFNYDKKIRCCQIDSKIRFVSTFSRCRCHTNVFGTLYFIFVRFLRLPRDWHRLVARHFTLGSKDQEPNIK